MLKVQLTSGEYKGEIVNATSAEGNLFGAVCHKGDSVSCAYERVRRV